MFCGLNDNDSDLVDLTLIGLLKLLVLIILGKFLLAACKARKPDPPKAIKARLPSPTILGDEKLLSLFIIVFSGVNVSWTHSSKSNWFSILFLERTKIFLSCNSLKIYWLQEIIKPSPIKIGRRKIESEVIGI